MRPDLHPACATFPALPDHDLKELAEDIRKNGLLEPVTLAPDGTLLDGRCRWDACEIVGITPASVTYDGDPIAFVLSKNKHRRHMDKAQLAMSVARLANLPAHRPSELSSLRETTYSNETLAKQSGLAESTIKNARVILKNAEPHIVAMVENCKIPIRVAAEAVRRIDRTKQANWTEADVRREGRKVLNAYPSKQNPAKPNSQPAKRIEYPKIAWPTSEEAEYPDASMSEADQRAWFNKYGHTPLHPKTVKDLLDADGLTSGLVASLTSLNYARHPDAETFFDLIDLLLSHVRQRDATNGLQTDFAAKGRKTISSLEQELPKALALLLALEADLKARNADCAETAVHVA